MQYDIFISYRRDGGEATAMAVRDRLAAKGYRVFLDVEALRSGPFNEALYRVIEQCKDVLVILSPNCLDRCVDEDDWVRLEIAYAFEQKKTIIPVMTRNFTFPDSLPPDIEPLRYQNGLTASVDMFDAFIEKLQKFLTSKPVPRRKLLIPAAAGLLAVILAGTVVAGRMTKYPSTQAQRNTVSEVIGYTMQNLTPTNRALDVYRESLAACSDYLNEEDQSRETLSLRLRSAGETVAAEKEKLKPADQTLSENLNDAPFAKGDVLAMPSALEVIYEDMLVHLTYLECYLLDEPYLTRETKRTCVKLYQEAADLLPDQLYYSLNEMLLPISDPDALEELKTQQLPHLSAIYRGQHWSHDPDELEGILEQSLGQEEKLLAKLATQVGDERRILDELEIRVDDLLEQGEQLTEAEQQLKELKEEAYEKFRPLAEDEPDLLWGKGLRFITLEMPEAAAECFKLYGQKGTETDRVCGTRAAWFVQQMGETGVTGGCMVFGYEEGLLHQDVAPGDIICGMDGIPTPHTEAYFAARDKGGDQIMQVLRFRADGNGYDLLDVPMKRDAGRIMLRDLNELG